MANGHGGRRTGDSERKRLAAGKHPYHLDAVTEDTAIAAMASGITAHALAPVIGRTEDALLDLAQRSRLDLQAHREKRLAAALDYAAARRLATGNLLAERVAELAIADNLEAKDVRDLAVAHGVLTDKRRLEEGLSTSNVSAKVQVWSRRQLPSTTPSAQD